MTQPWLTLLIIILVLLTLTLWCVWWQWEYRNNTFLRAQKEIQRACGGQDPYDSCRILMLGDEADNRLLCRSWSLTDGLEYWFGQWWYNQQCSLLCVPQALQKPGKKRLIRQNDWQKLLAALVKSRPQRPLDALVITLPLAALHADEDTQTQLLNNCQQIQQACGLSLPVYLIVSGLEEVEGTQDLLALLSEETRHSPVGSAIPVVREAVWKSVWIDEALENTQHTLREVITELGTLHGQTPGALFRLPEFFPTIAAPLHDYFDPLLNSNARDEPPLLRGIWFVARSVIGDKPQMQFCQNLLAGKIAAESGLALPVRRLLRLNLRRHFITLACYSCAGLLWLAAMIWSWHYQHTNALLLHDRLQLLAAQTTRDSATGERTAALYWRILNAVPQWQFRSVVWPGSLFSRTDYKLHETFQNATLASLLAPAANSICLQEQNARASEHDDLLPDERYRNITQLLAQTKQMETRYLPLLQLMQVKQPTVQTLAAISASVWGVTVDTDSLPSRTALNELFASLNISRLHLPDISDLTQRNSELFSRETMLWLEQNYNDTSLDNNEERLEQILTLFSNGTAITPLFVRSLIRQVNRLQSALVTINNLSRDAAHSPIRLPLDDLLTQARALRLIDNKVTQDLLRHEALLRQRFLAQVDGSRLHFSSLTEQSPEGEFSVSPDILALQKSLRDLLNQPFWQRGTSMASPEKSGYPGELQLQQALMFYSSYQRFIQQLPDSLWRPKLMLLAQNAAENAMQQALYADAPETASESHIDTLLADQAIDALIQLNRPQRAVALRQQIAVQLIARIRREGSSLLPSATPPTVNYVTPEQAQESGKRMVSWAVAQTEQISATLSRYQQDIEWLDRQRPWLNTADNQMIIRWIGSLNAMQRLQQQDPASPPARMTELAAMMPALNAQNCQNELAQFAAAGSNDFYSQSLNSLVSATQQKCQQLRQQASAGTVQKITSLYNVWLAGRFPFTTLPYAPDADVDRVRELTQLLATLPDGDDGGLPPLIQQLAAAQPLLSALLSPQGVVVRVNWRTQRNKEAGADQIADWRLSGNQQSISYPGGVTEDLHWRSGDNLNFSLRWAANSVWRPLPGSLQPGVTVAEDTGRWRWQGAWSLLRMISQQRPGGQLALPLSLRFSLPTGNGERRAQATVYLTIALLDAEGKAPLPWVPLSIKG
ncbi:TPA: type VI secretion system protein [Citrobacter freundii]